MKLKEQKLKDLIKQQEKENSDLRQIEKKKNNPKTYIYHNNK
jgi:hypothetical protein